MSNKQRELLNGWWFAHEQCTQRVEGSGVVSITRRLDSKWPLVTHLLSVNRHGVYWVDVPIEKARGGGVGLRVTCSYSVNVHRGISYVFTIDRGSRVASEYNNDGYHVYSVCTRQWTSVWLVPLIRGSTYQSDVLCHLFMDAVIRVLDN